MRLYAPKRQLNVSKLSLSSSPRSSAFLTLNWLIIPFDQEALDSYDEVMRILALLVIAARVYAGSSSLSALYSTLDPTSVAQHFAFYELYPKTPEGRTALKHAWDLLSGGTSGSDPELILPTLDLQPILSLVNRSSSTDSPVLNEDQLSVVEKLSKHLGNRKLQGFGLWDQDAILKLPGEEIDLGRALLIAELGSSSDAQPKIQSYEASLDLMALQILARLKPNANPLEKIRAINDYIFSEMRFRFPPQSLGAKEIDVYTFLPSVLDSRRGVCLGVSILYLCLAQRLELSLEAITPPDTFMSAMWIPKETISISKRLQEASTSRRSIT